MKLTDVEATETQIAERVDALRHTLDPEQRRAELDEVLAPFGPDGVWKYAPKAERTRAEKDYTAEQDRAAAFALFHVERAVLDTEPALAQIRASAMEAPSAEACWLARTNQPGVRAEIGLSVEILDELRRARIAGELRTLAPSAVLASYRQALADATEQGNATTIRIVEQTHGNGWTGGALTDAEAVAAVELRRAIAGAREARIPESIRKLEATIAKAKHAAGRAKSLNKIIPVNPRDLPGRAR